jgi:hypothetical protein
MTVSSALLWLDRRHDEHVLLGRNNSLLARSSLDQGHLLNGLLQHRLACAADRLLGLLARSSSTHYVARGRCRHRGRLLKPSSSLYYIMRRDMTLKEIQ